MGTNPLQKRLAGAPPEVVVDCRGETVGQQRKGGSADGQPRRGGQQQQRREGLRGDGRDISAGQLRRREPGRIQREIPSAAPEHQLVHLEALLVSSGMIFAVDAKRSKSFIKSRAPIGSGLLCLLQSSKADYRLILNRHY